MSRGLTICSYLAATILLPAVAIALRTIGLKRTCRCFRVTLLPRSAAPPRNKKIIPLAQPEAIHMIVHRVARRLPFNLQCLPRSIVICTLLHRFGFDAILRIGVRRKSPELDAHAWVECCKQPVGETQPQSKGLHSFT